MSTPDKYPEPQIQELIGNADIHDILANQLVPSGLPGHDTQKFFVAGHPDLVVRHSPDMEDIDDVREGLAATRGMQEFGVRMPKFAPVEHQGGLYVVTERVKGIDLPDAATPQASARTLQNIDRTYAGITRHLSASVVEGKPTPDDIYAPHQYMLGTAKSIPHRDVMLVDLPTIAERNRKHHIRLNIQCGL